MLSPANHDVGSHKRVHGSRYETIRGSLALRLYVRRYGERLVQSSRGRAIVKPDILSVSPSSQNEILRG